MTDLPSESETLDAPRSERGDAPRGEIPGGRIGPYRLLEQIGQGGFGSVFVAEQEHPVRRRVALKLIKLGMDTHDVVARFEAERQALALMDHPNIAHVFDGGATATGRPYFVMELVKGEPITAYADSNRLSVAERLSLFEQVCAAVQHAHGKGVIHRDIKPSNVLVSTEDGKPFAKVIDFGIAKATSSRLTEKTLYTEHHELIGTPEYMSPEQAEGSLDIDTRTDVYALGVLLYELLTGATPFDSKSLRSAGYGEIQRIIREVEPKRPSARLAEAGASLADVASRRSSDPRKLTASVRGELDWIVMKAMEKDRSRRYETANGLAMDVRRHLEGEPVVAAPPSLAYRARKFAGRHRAAVTAGLLVAAALVLGIVGTTAGMIRAERQRRASERVAGFMKDVLGGVAPAVARGRDTAMLKEMMDQAAARIEKGGLADAPEAEIELRTSIGGTQQDLAAYEASERMLVPAVAEARARYGADPKTADALYQLAILRREQGRYPEAESLLREVLEIRTKRLGAGSAQVASTMGDVAVVLAIQNKLAEAEALLRDAVARSVKAGATETRDHAALLNNLALTLRREGKLAEAEATYREALAIAKRVLGDSHWDVAVFLGNLALVLRNEGKPVEAEAMYREALALSRKILGDVHPNVAANLNGLATALRDQGRYAEAEPLLRESLAMMRHLVGNGHANTAKNIDNLVSVLVPQRKFAEAEPLAREAVAIADRAVPGGSDAGRFRVSLGRVLTGEGRFSEAEKVLLEADRIYATAQGVPAAQHADERRALGSLYSEWDRTAPGRGYAAKAAEWQAKPGT
jgi:serine/threonine protein kinase/tetratricopeptide (TPR) repeat protein